MRVIKITLIVIGSIVALTFIAIGIYLLLNIQGEAESFEVGSPSLEHKVLIASQGSDFKNALVDSLTTKLKEREFYIKVIDVSSLEEINEDDWNALVIIHTTQQYTLYPPVKKYLDKANDLSKVILVTTSGTGEWKTEDFEVDIFTTASKMEEIGSIVDNILIKLEVIPGIEI